MNVDMPGHHITDRVIDLGLYLEMALSYHSATGEKVSDYLQEIQGGRLIQSYGCLLALDEATSKVIAYSSNALEMLTSDASHPGITGTHVCSLFAEPGASELEKALGAAKVSPLNLIMLQTKTSNKAFYAFLHSTTSCVLIDFEPVVPEEFPTMASTYTDIQPFSLALKASSKLKSLHCGSIKELCNIVAQQLLELTGYDRVMVNKFHEDGRGDIIAEATSPGLEPYLGMHYPATDIPEASRFLFVMNRVRMVCDSHAKFVQIVADGKTPFEINLCSSLLRAPHSCHLQYMKNMKTTASLTMAVIIMDNTNDEAYSEVELKELTKKNQDNKKLWGLIICHNETPRYAPFSLRCACEFLVQMFAVLVHKELNSEKHRHEKRTLKVLSALSGVLLREASSPGSIINGNPNIMSLVKCDGAAILHGDKVWRRHVAPTNVEIRMIVNWLLDIHRDSGVMSTDSLYDAGYPRALVLDHHAVICGLAAAIVNSNYIVLWFRSHNTATPTATWGGAKHGPSEEDKTNGMGPRSSFKPLLFIEVEKMTKSLPWKDYEMEGIQSLRLVLKETQSILGTKEEEKPRISSFTLAGPESSLSNNKLG
ncbi:hypothetical protein EJB05_43767, partial [Eragrostis curvula]